MGLAKNHIIKSLMLLTFIVGSQARAIVSNSVLNEKSAGYFPETPFVRDQVKFWNAVFLKYPASSALIHDSYYPTMIIDLIDYDVFIKKLGRDGASSRRRRDSIIYQYLRRYELGLQRFKRHQSAAAKMGAIENRLFNVYRKDPQALRDLYLGRVSIRYQAGLADEFQVAAKRAAPFLPHMEKIFQAQGLPTDLTRLPFVESMFNPAAFSKVGASGIWQFMPGTARSFMRVDSYIDERSNPLKATRGASKLLKENYSVLKSWPLAITAYNHGAASMQRAVRRLGTKNFETIVRRYDAPSFGFASRNFYAEFLAARGVYNVMFKRYNTGDDAAQVKSIRLSNPVSISYLLANTPLTRETLTRHNRCLQPRAMQRYYNQPLPRNFELIVPQNIAQSISLAVASTRERKVRF